MCNDACLSMTTHEMHLFGWAVSLWTRPPCTGPQKVTPWGRVRGGHHMVPTTIPSFLSRGGEGDGMVSFLSTSRGCGSVGWGPPPAPPSPDGVVWVCVGLSASLTTSSLSTAFKKSSRPPDSYSVSVSLWLSFLELHSTIQMGCSTKCALLRRSGAVFHWRPGRLTDQHPLEPVVPRPIHRESTGGPVKLRRATAPS